MKKIIVLLLMVVISVSYYFYTDKDRKERKIIRKVIVREYDEARRLVYDKFKGDNALALLHFISKREGDAYKDKLVIEKWEWDFWSTRGYDYIRGSVKNTGNKTIRYFKIKALYKDENGNVIDTAYTNSGNTLMPNMSKKFKIMHSFRKEYDSVSISIEEVSLK